MRPARSRTPKRYSRVRAARRGTAETDIPRVGRVSPAPPSTELLDAPWRRAYLGSGMSTPPSIASSPSCSTSATAFSGWPASAAAETSSPSAFSGPVRSSPRASARASRNSWRKRGRGRRAFASSSNGASRPLRRVISRTRESTGSSATPSSWSPWRRRTRTPVRPIRISSAIRPPRPTSNFTTTPGLGRRSPGDRDRAGRGSGGVRVRSADHEQRRGHVRPHRRRRCHRALERLSRHVQGFVSVAQRRSGRRRRGREEPARVPLDRPAPLGRARSAGGRRPRGRPARTSKTRRAHRYPHAKCRSSSIRTRLGRSSGCSRAA